MPGRVKFTSYGIPYVEEFSDVAITSADQPKLARCPTCGHHSPQEEDIEGGLYIQMRLRRRHTTSEFAPSSTLLPGKLSDGRLLRLKRAIAEAVTAAGMATPPPETESKDNDSSSLMGRLRPLLRRGSTNSTTGRTPSTSLFRGTYGQVMEALDRAGLSTAPCPSSGFGEATRLGALFVAKAEDVGSVRFEKLTLWG